MSPPFVCSPVHEILCATSLRDERRLKLCGRKGGVNISRADPEYLGEHTPQRLYPTDGNLVWLLIGSQALAVRLVSS